MVGWTSKDKILSIACIFFWNTFFKTLFLEHDMTWPSRFLFQISFSRCLTNPLLFPSSNKLPAVKKYPTIWIFNVSSSFEWYLDWIWLDNLTPLEHMYNCITLIQHLRRSEICLDLSFSMNFSHRFHHPLMIRCCALPSPRGVEPAREGRLGSVGAGLGRTSGEAEDCCSRAAQRSRNDSGDMAMDQYL